MPPCIDCYTMINRRDKQTAIEFLDTFLPRRRWLDYDSEAADAQMTFLEAHPKRLRTLYAVNEGAPEPNYAMLGYTRDGHMTLGLSCEEEHPELATEYLRQLQALAGTDHGYCGAEVAPPVSFSEYEASVHAYRSGSPLPGAFPPGAS